MDPDTQTSDDEHLESIPWSQLMAEAKTDRPLLVYVAAAALLALAVGVVVARGLGRSTAAPAPVALSPVTSQETVVAEPITEADLRAPLFPTEVGVLAVIPRAEWFVADYFTADGAGDRLAVLEDALGWSPPPAEISSTTYVEWARAWDSMELSDGRYRVLVAYRAISNLNGAFTRGPVRGVAVSVQLGADGGTRVIDLPEPVPLPPEPAAATAADAEPVPESVAESAQELARSWSDDVAVVGGSELEDTWRVVIEVDVASGRWPLVVWVDK